MGGFLFQAFIYLTAAVIAVPIAKRMGLGSVLGYLIAGIIIGPVIGLVGTETQDLQHFAEFGVVMMLFVVGLELEPRLLWEMRHKLLGLGGLQVLLTASAIAGIGILLEFDWRTSVAAGFLLALSSTAIVLQTLGEKALMKSEGGQACFSVLLFQDIAVIPMLAFIPLLAIPELMGNVAGEGAAIIVGEHGADAGHATMSLVDGLPSWGIALVTLGSIAAVIFGGHYLSMPLFRFIAESKLREMFTAVVLLLVIAISLLMTLVGLSPALGTFLAGVVLANSEYRHELEADIEPFKGLLLGLFFITVGAGINFDVLFGEFGKIIAMVIGVMSLKAGVLYLLSKIFKLPKPDNLLFTLGLAQAGEFGFVLLSFSTQNSVIDGETGKLLSLVVALSMLLTPALFIFYDKVISRRSSGTDEREPDVIDEKGTVIIAGLGRFGQVVNRMLLAHGTRAVVLDNRADVVDGLKTFGVKGFYGDATRPDLLHSAGLREATMIVVAIDDRERSIELVSHARRDNPKIHIIARAFDRLHVYQLYKAGADDIVREVFDSSVRAGKYALQKLGQHPFEVEKAANVFVDHDRETLRHLANVWQDGVSVYDNPEYIDAAKARNKLMDDAVKGLKTELHDRTERGWTPPPKDGR